MEKYKFKISNTTEQEKKIVLFGGDQKFTDKSTVFDDQVTIECEPMPYKELLGKFSTMTVVTEILTNRHAEITIISEDPAGHQAMRQLNCSKGVMIRRETGLFAIDSFTIFVFSLPAKSEINIEMLAFKIEVA
jgi:hypothetical protein